MLPERRRLIIDPEIAGPMRTRVGATAWCVLESLAAAAPPGREIVEMDCTSRRLGARLGLSKDSAARALRRLTEAGIVERTDYRDPRSGRFDPSIYVIDFAAAGLAIEAVSSPPDTATSDFRLGPPTAVPADRSDSRLSLLRWPNPPGPPHPARARSSNGHLFPNDFSSHDHQLPITHPRLTNLHHDARAVVFPAGHGVLRHGWGVR